MSDGLTLPADVADALLSHARAERPSEACGLLAGLHPHGPITRYHSARNALVSRYAYEVDAGDLVRLLDRIDTDGEVLVAIFHSHPATPATPSARDLREAVLPVFQVIASLADPGATAEVALRAWRIVDGTPREVRLRIVPAQQLPIERRSTISSLRGSTTTSRPHEPSSPPDR